MSLTVALLAGIAVISALALARYYPDRTRRLWQYIQSTRKVLFGVFAVVTALVFLGSGVFALQIAGFAMILYITLTVLFDDLPDPREVIGW
jgi:hypothetical protein